MRITTGIYRGRQIRMPQGIRPTQDKVRKALFDILGDIEGLSFLELYAGSGAVGLEAASRGVRELVMVEYNRDCLQVIKKNIELLTPRACELYPKESDLAIRAMHNVRRQFDIIFLDPPYYKASPHSSHALKKKAGNPGLRQGQGESLTKKTLQTLGAYDILAPNGFVIVQHFKKDELPTKERELALVKQAQYGDTVLSFYRKV